MELIQMKEIDLIIRNSK